MSPFDIGTQLEITDTKVIEMINVTLGKTYIGATAGKKSAIDRLLNACLDKLYTECRVLDFNDTAIKLSVRSGHDIDVIADTIHGSIVDICNRHIYLELETRKVPVAISGSYNGTVTDIDGEKYTFDVFADDRSSIEVTNLLKFLMSAGLLEEIYPWLSTLTVDLFNASYESVSTKVLWFDSSQYYEFIVFIKDTLAKMYPALDRSKIALVDYKRRANRIQVSYRGEVPAGVPLECTYLGTTVSIEPQSIKTETTPLLK